MEDIIKAFPGVRAPNSMTITVHKGEVIELMGEDGAGKSTLMNMLGGVFATNSGDICIEGKMVSIHSVHGSQNMGMASIHQELAPEPYPMIAENTFLGCETRNSFRMVSKDKMVEAVGSLLERVGLGVDPNENAGRPSIGQQQMVEIARSFSLNAKILILGEPVSSLSEKEVDIPFKTVGDLKKQGMEVVFITHKIAEVLQLCDTITIMRNGEFMGELQSKGCTEAQFMFLAVGRDLGSYYVRTFNELGQVVLGVRSICTREEAINCNFSVRKGEILDFYGLVGADRSELMKAVMGLGPLDSEEVYLKGELVKRPDPMSMRKRGIAFVPESRETEGLSLKNTIAFNISLPVLDRFMRGMWVGADKEVGIVEQGIDALKVRASSSDINCSTLSRGNQQKVLPAKWLTTDPEVLALDEPTRGIDVGVKAGICTIINNLVEERLAIILVSSKVPEVMSMGDRIVIIHEGRITGKLAHQDGISQEMILTYAMGVNKNE